MNTTILATGNFSKKNEMKKSDGCLQYYWLHFLLGHLSSIYDISSFKYEFYFLVDII